MMIIAIDGPAGVGKSTVARCIAERLHLPHVNSGDLYRAVTYLAIMAQYLSPLREEAIILLARDLTCRIVEGVLDIDGIPSLSELHTDQVDRWVAQVSSLPEVRNHVTEKLRTLVRESGGVVEGRDIGTVVFPDTPYKFFLDATPEERARRRFLQGTSSLPYEELVKEIRRRDEIDRNKPLGALKQAPGAVYIDTSDLTSEAVCEKVIQIIRQISENRSRTDMMNHQNSTLDPQMNTSPDPSVPEQEELQEIYLKTLEEVEEGSLVEGTVIEINKDYVYLDVGYKSEGQVPISDFDTLPKVGDTVPVVILRKETADGHILVSKKKADQRLFWKTLKDAFQEKKPIEGKIVREIKGGFEVDLGHGFSGFLPRSQTDIERVEDVSPYIGLETRFLIERLFSNRKVNIVLSRRRWLEEERERKRTEFFETRKEGDIVEGVVKSFAPFGAFIDLGGFDGLLHLQDMSWGRAVRPKDYVKKGEKVRVKIIKMDREQQKVNLSLKALKEDPWTHFEERYHRGDVVEGVVTKLMPFGAFVEIEEGIEGLVHISEMSWVKTIEHPKEVLKRGAKIQAKILDYDIQERRLSLGIRQLQENPWETLHERYPVGMRLTRPITQVFPHGAVVELEEGIEAFLPAENISWTERVEDVTTLFQPGQEIEFCITRIDKRRRRIQIGIKQLSEDPWKALAKAFPEGSEIETKVLRKEPQGIVVEVQGGIEGFIPNRQLCDPAVESPETVRDRLKEGDTIRALVLELKPSKRRLILSIREKEKKEQERELSKYLHEGEGETTFSIADLLSSGQEDESE
ncbi:30S ribosomal protein S1 [Spirochaeta thermophila DSM 6192]|uniref:Cytidylate kinase n=2 Tax=Winmispira thermophila TaxID=154 RepID=E0RSQ5_WINT6|nr:30S ribosomal protein S1 [Spirochaeta thermophila DSM 6192]